MKTQGLSVAGRTQYVHRRARNATGVVGISLLTRRDPRRRNRRTYHYFAVCPHRKVFCVETLGREEAWRRAVALRAAHERAVLAKKGAA